MDKEQLVTLHFFDLEMEALEMVSDLAWKKIPAFCLLEDTQWTVQVEVKYVEQALSYLHKEGKLDEAHYKKILLYHLGMKNEDKKLKDKPKSHILPIHRGYTAVVLFFVVFSVLAMFSLALHPGKKEYIYLISNDKISNNLTTAHLINKTWCWAEKEDCVEFIKIISDTNFEYYANGKVYIGDYSISDYGSIVFRHKERKIIPIRGSYRYILIKNTILYLKQGSKDHFFIEK